MGRYVTGIDRQGKKSKTLIKQANHIHLENAITFGAVRNLL